MQTDWWSTFWSRRRRTTPGRSADQEKAAVELDRTLIDT
jgi:hypothetical protein